MLTSPTPLTACTRKRASTAGDPCSAALASVKVPVHWVESVALWVSSTDCHWPWSGPDEVPV